jgi:hypothetical protein
MKTTRAAPVNATCRPSRFHPVSPAPFGDSLAKGHIFERKALSQKHRVDEVDLMTVYYKTGSNTPPLGA